MTHDSRSNADMARQTIEYFSNLPAQDPDPEAAIVDLLTNLMHMCAQDGIKFKEMLRIARNHFMAEMQREIYQPKEDSHG